ncbi:protein ALTERED PHOSPHATE STARVATION RESPONSE 1-like [Lolium perenne]|uniref:protein ALTERED PHOSPHATE STARVATION RESPONSE 1-like n=1 Tax=Lolium perenne TaxID=4522 RepID=UPI0021F5A483|nr:protein ALTERED PHOSPHATE STARVATION RESPONSE 1-like [Lolium perenne]
MGVASSKMEDDKVLVLCQERKRIVREALDRRCALASTHYDYIVSLKDTGSLLKKCFEGDKGAANEEDFADSDPSTETLEQVSKSHSTSTEQSTADHASKSVASENIASSYSLKHKSRTIDVITNENDEIPAMNLVNVVSSSVPTRHMDSKEHYPDVSNVVRDLSSCMKEIEILFFRAGDSGKQVPMILEEDKIQFRPLLSEEIAHGSNALNFLATFLICCKEEVSVPEPPPQAEIKYLTWHRSVSSQLLPSKNPPGHILDIHTSTLDRLYAWETKLYDEVKASSSICKKYDEKCKQLSDQESRGKNQIITDFTRATVKDLHSRVLVAIQKIDFISNNIEDLRDKELQPQLDELIENLTRMWATMLQCHRRQHAIIKLLSSRCKLEIPLDSESQCQAALLLSAELSKLCWNFQNWVASHKAYLHSLNLWLHKCMKPLKKKKGSRKQNVVDVTLTECAVAPIFITCEIWIKLLDDLPTQDLEEAIAGLAADIRRHLPRHLNQGLDQTLNDEEEVPRNYTAADIQSSLVTFIAKLEAFSEISVQKYIDLQKGICAAKDRLLGAA